MWQRRGRNTKRNSYGVASIRRDSYNSYNGWSEKAGWWELVSLVSKRSGGQCEAYYSGIRCENRAKEVHHIVPLSKGGANAMSNLIHFCERCHTRRHNHLYRK